MRSPPSAAQLLALLPLALTAWFLWQAPAAASTPGLRWRWPWVPSLGTDLSFHLDGLALLFCLLIAGIGTLIVIYAGGYLAGHPFLGRFLAILLLFLGSMLGVVLADNVIALFVFWELTSITSYLLIGFEHEKPRARAAALQALLVTGGGGLALLAGLVLLSQVGGSAEISELATRGDLVRASPLYPAILALVLVGAFTKSAQVPFHFWLPAAMEAPTPVSAYLHSATMVKAGVYLLARLNPVLGGTDGWLLAITAVGAITMAVAGILALYQTDLKLLLAYSTVSALGTLTMLLGLGTPYAARAVVVFLLAHALYKGALFMIAGAVDHETGTRDVEQLGGLRRTMPLTAAAAGLAALSLAGFGPVLSFIGKELLLEAVLRVEAARPVLVPGVVLGGALFAAVAAIVAIRPFFGRATAAAAHAHEAPPSLWVGPAILAVAGLVIGLAPQTVAEALVAPAVWSVLARPEPVDLALWHGLNAALALSVVSLLLGAGLYLSWTGLRRRTSWVERAFAWGPQRWYALSLDGLNWLAMSQTRLLQNGYMRYYLLTITGTTVALVSYVVISRNGLMPVAMRTAPRFYDIVVAALILLGALAAVTATTRLAAIASLGAVGYGVALIFVFFGAPDLAMTQVLIETLSVILFVLVLYHLPQFAALSSRRARLRDLVVSLAAGSVMATLTLLATGSQLAEPISRFFAERSEPEAHGRNVVNVILVDFRALDTMGEITVLALAGVGVFALLKLRLHRDTERQRLAHRAPSSGQATEEPALTPSGARSGEVQP